MQIQQIFFGSPAIPKAKYIFSENDNNYKLSAKNKNKRIINFLVEKKNFRIVKASYYREEDHYFSFDIMNYYLLKLYFHH